MWKESQLYSQVIQDAAGFTGVSQHSEGSSTWLNVDSCHLEMLNNFWARGPIFSLYTELAIYVARAYHCDLRERLPIKNSNYTAKVDFCLIKNNTDKVIRHHDGLAEVIHKVTNLQDTTT